MIACSILSLLLLGAAGTMIDTHRRDWRRVTGAGSGGETPPDADRERFARSRHRRRMTASVLIAVAGGLIGVWPITPRTPFWVMTYTATLSLAALALLACGVYDGIASKRRHRKLSRELFRRRRREMVEAVERLGGAAVETRDDDLTAADDRG